MTFEIWSCNPADIPPWTEEKKAELYAFLRATFGWKEKPLINMHANIRDFSTWTFEDVKSLDQAIHDLYGTRLKTDEEIQKEVEAQYEQIYVDFARKYYR